MNKKELIIISIIFTLASVWYVLSLNANKLPDANSRASVYHNDKEILNIDMNVNDTYVVNGELGDVVIEVLDKQIRVAEEVSPLNYCSLQGWVDKTNVPIICLPNRIMVVIEGEHNNPEDDITTQLRKTAHYNL